MSGPHDAAGPLRVVAFGGGHGLSASLRALRLLRGQWSAGRQRRELEVTAVVTVGDDGGSSGRLRAERGGLPPGDLRQALVALADADDPTADLTARLFQHRFDGNGQLSGHPVGNLTLLGLMELMGDPVDALDHAARLLGCCGRVLPMSRHAVSLEADVLGGDPARPDDVVAVRGQHAVAVTRGEVRRVRLLPERPVACAEALAAVEAADWLIFGPGSWFTSVIPHLLVPDLAAAVSNSRAKRLVTLNLAAEKETSGLSLPDHLAALARYLPGLRFDVVLADGKAVGDPEPVHRAAESLGARLSLAPVAVPDGSPRHDPAALAAALEAVLGPP
ncbi:gluconeogenesis factor YvcK family protein [Planosporangium mesophilum]|uniref:Putative gluconeogenesis factor n=1 Tax=Planosporangium mesophilum TaxID=689768 RepID=A0A8J3T9F0_9ACTN|nr:uridine diphosphate-N-acetylglucosamine-binding protein YvcK [Planosporangium mesophilum]NJC83316.1 uridine diphosphate-N-acetylglucosamine-binding protein YvcK [Planosporangium mesophilum]GII21692.1 putative gluconeogenesis factor [Planosporangium mesophilum]